MPARVRHVALFRWRTDSAIDVGAASAELHRIVEGSAGATNLQVGTGLGLSGASGFDFGLTVDFEDQDAYLAYRNNPDHQRLLTEVLVPASDEVSAIQLTLAE